jgi:hypothetical protein
VLSFWRGKSGLEQRGHADPFIKYLPR